MRIGSKISEFRHAAGWTQTKLARLIDSNCRTIENWENDTSIPSIESLLKLCHVFHTTPNVLLGFSEKNVLVLDGLPQDDQIVLKGVFQLLWDRNSHRAKWNID